MRLFLPALLSLCLMSAFIGCRSRNQQSANEAAATAATSETGTPPAAQSEAQKYLAEGNEFFYEKDQDQEAIEAYRKAIELDPDYGEAYFRLGLAYAATGKKEEAEQSFTKAVEALEKYTRTNQKDAQSYYIMGQSLMRLGNFQDASKSLKSYQDAVKALKKAVSLEPENGDMYYELGQAHNKLIQYKEAVAAFEKATELDPGNYRASEALEEAKQDLDRFNTLYKREEAKVKQEEAARRRKEEENANGNKNTSDELGEPPPLPKAPPGNTSNM